MIDAISVQNHLRSMPGLTPLTQSTELPGMDALDAVGPSKGAEKAEFGNFLSDAIKQVSELDATADQAVVDLATGESGDVHEALIAMQKAEISMRMLLEVRNKVISAYQEIMRLQA